MSEEEDNASMNGSAPHSPLVSNRQSSSRDNANQSTFVDGPSTFLQNLTAKVNGFSQGGGNSIAEVQRIRTELSNQVQSVSNKQEMQMRQLDSQLSMLQQEMKPKLQNIERQQGFTQKQLEELRQRVQKLQTEELSPLQYKFDQMGVRFDRFMRVEIESKLKPLQDDLRQSRTKLDELSSTTNTNFRKINDQVNELTEKVKGLNVNLVTHKTSYDTQLKDIEPKLDNLEKEMAELADFLGGGSSRSSSNQSSDSPDGLEKQLKAAQMAVDRLQNETIPTSIQDSSVNFIEALQQVSQFCDDKLNNLQSSLDAITCSNQVVDQQRQQAEEQLDQLLKVSFDVQNKIQSLDQDSKSQLLMLEQTLESSASNLKSLLDDLTSEASNGSDKTQKMIDEEIGQLRTSIQTSVRKLRETIKVSSGANLQAQTEAFAQISVIQNQLEGKENAVGRVDSVEGRIKWCIESIQEIDKERLDAQSKNGSPQNIATRLLSIEERLLAIDGRINKIDGKSKGKMAPTKKDDKNNKVDNKVEKNNNKNKDNDDNEDDDEEEEEKKEEEKKQKKGAKKTETKEKQKKNVKNDDENEEEDDEEDENEKEEKKEAKKKGGNKKEEETPAKKKVGDKTKKKKEEKKEEEEENEEDKDEEEEKEEKEKPASKKANNKKKGEEVKPDNSKKGASKKAAEENDEKEENDDEDEAAKPAPKKKAKKNEDKNEEKPEDEAPEKGKAKGKKAVKDEPPANPPSEEKPAKKSKK